MEELFLKMLNMSLTASYVIVFVMLVRVLIRKLPKIISYVLWSVVAIRLTFPFSFKSDFSLLPKNININPIPSDIAMQQAPQVETGVNVVDGVINNSLPIPEVGASVNPLQVYIAIGMWVWVLGIVVLLAYYVYSIVKLKKQLRNAENVSENIYCAENLKTPFVFGVINPKIYLPNGLAKDEKNYIIEHERVHILRKDYLVKTYGYILLSIYWINPLVWVAFVLMNRDMELSCDERVLKEVNIEGRKLYAKSLVSLSTDTPVINRIAFGEGNIKNRVKNILRYKKKNIFLISTVVVICVIIGIGLLLNPKADTNAVSDTIVTNATKEYEKDASLVEEMTYGSLIGEKNSDSGLFWFGMTSDEVFDLLGNDSTGLVINTREDGNYDDKFLRKMDELDEDAEVRYEYTLSDSLRLYFDDEKILKSISVQHAFPVSSYVDVLKYYESHQDNMFYNSELTTEKGLNLLSTLNDLLTLYGQPDYYYEKDSGDLYIYELRDDLYLTVIIINDGIEPFVYRISYRNDKPPIIR